MWNSIVNKIQSLSSLQTAGSGSTNPLRSENKNDNAQQMPFVMPASELPAPPPPAIVRGGTNRFLAEHRLSEVDFREAKPRGAPFVGLDSAVSAAYAEDARAAIEKSQFHGDPSYKLINKGSVEHGEVILLPNLHKAIQDANLPTGTSSEMDQAIFFINMMSFHELKKKNAMDVFPEGTTPEKAEMFNNPSRITDPNFLKNFRDIGTIIEHHGEDGMEQALAEMSQSQKDFFATWGGMLMYAVCKSQNVTVYATSTNEVQQRLRDIAHKRPKERTEADVAFVDDDREKLVEDRVEFSKPQRNGRPAFIGFGALHTFANAFRGKNAPAFYRKDWTFEADLNS